MREFAPSARPDDESRGAEVDKGPTRARGSLFVVAERPGAFIYMRTRETCGRYRKDARLASLARTIRVSPRVPRPRGIRSRSVASQGCLSQLYDMVAPSPADPSLSVSLVSGEGDTLTRHAS